MLLAQIARCHSKGLIEEITHKKFQLSSSKTEFFTAVWSFDFFQTIFYSLHAFIRITARARTRTPAYLEELRRNSFFLWFWWKIQIWNPYVTRISNSAGDFGFVFFKKLRFSSAAAGGPDKSMAYFALILLILALKKKKFDFFPKYKQIWGVVFRKTTLFFSRN